MNTLSHMTIYNNIFFFLSSLPALRPDIPDADPDSVLRHSATEFEHRVLIDQAGRGSGEDAAERVGRDGPRLRAGRAGDARRLQRALAAPLRGAHPAAPGRLAQPRRHHARARARHASALGGGAAKCELLLSDAAMWNEL